MNKSLPSAAYFSMEFGLSPLLKTYAGGLGILAGDYLKGAHDYDYPVIGVGILWKQGYTDQCIDSNGKPYDTYHNYKYDFLTDTGVKVNVAIRNRNVIIKVWKVDCFNNAPLYLLDTDLPENEDAWITGQLYGWFEEERIAQEMVLGIGGVRALKALGIKPDIYHFNEGHAVFAGLELISENLMDGDNFENAVNAVKKKIVFTTHTPIKQGNESHNIESLMYMGANDGLTSEQLAEIGGSPFNMTAAALRLSKISNAVSDLHTKTANKMWQSINNRSDIIGITNAIHIPTWVNENIIKTADGRGDIWDEHVKSKKALIEFVYNRNKVRLNPDVLLIGFSRRAAPYKRSSLIFTNESIIGPLIKNKKIQLVLSGKAHPLDDTGKSIIENIVKLTNKYPDAVVFLENYDMEIGKMLTSGSDVWLNCPRVPMEASGTSGMKAAMNGVLNLSTLDGWWPEVCRHGINGWQFGDGKVYSDIKAADKNDSDELYNVLLNEVIPVYYNNKDRWIDMMHQSIKDTVDKFSVKRMLYDYYNKMYKI